MLPGDGGLGRHQSQVHTGQGGYHRAADTWRAVDQYQIHMARLCQIASHLPNHGHQLS